MPHLPGFQPTRKALASLAVAAALVAGAGCGGKASQQEQAKVHWNAARGQVLQQLAEEQFAAGQLDEARDTCNQAMTVTDQLPGLYLLSARIDIERNDLTRASSALGAARSLSPAPQVLAQVEHSAGVIAERWEKTEDAVQHHERSTRLDPNEPAYLIAYAEALVSAGKAEEAAAALQGRVAHFEGDAAVRDALGQVLQALGDHETAAEMFRQASIFAPDDNSVRERLAFATMQAGDLVRASVLFEKLLKNPDLAESVSLRVAAGECRMARGEYEKAVDAFQQAARLDDRHVPAWLGVAKVSLEVGQHRRARLALDRARRIAPRNAEVRMLDGYLLMEEGNLTAAAAAFGEAATLQTGDATAHALRGHCLAKLGRYDAASDAFDAADRVSPGDDLVRELRLRADSLQQQAVANTDGQAIVE